MPLSVHCNECGYLLYQGTVIRPPYEIAKEYNEKCPDCGKKLSSFPIDVKIKPATDKKLKIVSPPGTVKSSHKIEYLSIPKMKLSEEPTELFEADFLDTFRKGINELKKFDLYKVYKAISHVGGHGTSRYGKVLFLRLALDKKKYFRVTRMLEANIKEDECAYYEREDPFNEPWRQVNHRTVPLKTREKYQTILMRRFKELFEILKPKNKLNQFPLLQE